MKSAYIALAVVLLAACSSSQSIEQSRDLSSSGLIYTAAVETLIDSTITRVIDFNSAGLVKMRRGQSESQLRQVLALHNEALVLQVVELETFKKQIKLLRAYFLNLQALADSPIKADVGGAVTALSGSINNLNQSVGGMWSLLL